MASCLKGLFIQQSSIIDCKEEKLESKEQMWREKGREGDVLCAHGRETRGVRERGGGREIERAASY